MARYEHLPLFKSIYDFNIYLFKLSQGFSKDYKYGLAIEIKNLTSELMDLIILANNAEIERDSYLRKAEIDIERIKIKIRMLFDLKVINMKSYKYISSVLIEIGKQIGAWRRWSVKNQTK